MTDTALWQRYCDHRAVFGANADAALIASGVERETVAALSAYWRRRRSAATWDLVIGTVLALISPVGVVLLGITHRGGSPDAVVAGNVGAVVLLVVFGLALARAGRGRRDRRE